MRRALCLLRESPHYRRQCFVEGLQTAGFRVADAPFDPEPDDCVLLWNRYGKNDATARRFDAVGAAVLVAENAYVRRKDWYSLSRDHHAGAGRWCVRGPERWASFGVELQPWRAAGETVILGQRCIGERGIASPMGWELGVKRAYGGRIRPHPGKHGNPPPLEQDLAKAGAAITWASSAALTALILGIPVFHGLPTWIGAPAARPVTELAAGPLRDDAARLAAFERLAWAMAPLDEIRSGEAIVRLLEHA